MGKGIIKLEYSSKYEIYFTNNPEITFFKSIYHRYKNFAIQPIEIKHTGNINFGDTIKINIDKVGDLINTIYVKIIINEIISNNVISWIDRLAHYLFESISINIGGQVIEKHYPNWFDIYYEVFSNKNKEYLDIINPPINNSNHIPEFSIYLPLRFWFNNNFGKSLPLIALHYQDIQVSLSINTLNKLLNNDNNSYNSLISIKNISLICDYVFIELDERMKLAQGFYEYLIETVEFTRNSIIEGSNNIELFYKNNIKEIFWLSNDFHFKKGRILVNNVERTKFLNSNFLNYCIPLTHHRNIPRKGIYMYSFALYPDISQPSGFINMNKINSLILELIYKKNTSIQIFTLTYKKYIINNGYSKLIL